VVSLGIFSVVPPTEPCALRPTQHLKVSTRDFSWGKGGRCVWLTTYHTCSAETSRKSGALIYPEPLGPPRPLLFFYFPIYFDFPAFLSIFFSKFFPLSRFCAFYPSSCLYFRTSHISSLLISLKTFCLSSSHSLFLSLCCILYFSVCRLQVRYSIVIS